LTQRESALPRSAAVHGVLFTVALMFSVNYVVSKLGMREFSPLSFAWLRVAVSALILWVVMRDTEPFSRADAWLVFRFAILGVVINQTLFLAGLSLTSVQVSAVLITTIPVFTLAIAILAGQERASASRIGGIALAGAGALLVVGGESFGGSWRSFAGALMLVINCLSYAGYLVLSKPHMTRLSARAIVRRMFAIGAAMLLPIAAVPLAREQWTQITPRAWLSLAFVIIGPTIIAYLLQAWALRHADSSVVAAYTYVQPVLATLLGVIFLNETLQANVLVAAAMIFGGVWLASSRGGGTPPGQPPGRRRSGAPASTPAG
jgi:drug/metabolite transporter (DMT)-like permease